MSPRIALMFAAGLMLAVLSSPGHAQGPPGGPRGPGGRAVPVALVAPAVLPCSCLPRSRKNWRLTTNRRASSRSSRHGMRKSAGSRSGEVGSQTLIARR